MAPKAKAAAADAKPKAKSEKKQKKEEDEGPKMTPPDRDAHDAAVAAITQEVDAAQTELRSISAQINERTSGRGEFNNRRLELKNLLDLKSAEIAELQGQMTGVSSQVQAQKEQGRAMRQDVLKMKRTLGDLDSEEAIDDAIAGMEFKMSTESMPLREEKKMLEQIKEMKKRKPKIAELNQRQAAVDNFDVGAPLKDQLDGYKESLSTLRGQKRELTEALNALIAENKEKTGDMTELFNQRDVLNKVAQEAIQRRAELRDQFRQANNEYQQWENDQRKAKADKRREEKAQRDAEWEREQRVRRAEKLDVQPHLEETTLLEQTLHWCRSMLPKGAAEQTDTSAKKDLDAGDGSLCLVKKSDRDEEFFFAPTKKKGAGKKEAKGKKESSKAIKHNVETFHYFTKLKVEAPITTDDLPGTITKLEAELASYNEKIRAWEREKEELKRKIIEDGYNPDERRGDDGEGAAASSGETAAAAADGEETEN